MAEIAPISGYDDRVELAAVLPLAVPFTLNVFPTNSCNFRCTYCAQSQGSESLKRDYGFRRSEHMSLETFKEIVKSSQEFSSPYKVLSFMGHGEPLVNRDLPAMVKLAKEANIAQRLEIITNGSLLTPELSDRLIAAGISRVRISLQGLNSQVYEQTCGVKIDFEQFLEQLAYFHRQSRNSESQLFVKILDCSLQDGEEKSFYQLFDNISHRMFIEQVKPVYAGVAATQHLNDLTTDRYGQKHAPRLVCPLAFFSLAIWPNGDIAPCDAIYKPLTIGRVGEVSLVEAFTGPLANSFRHKLLSGQKNSMPGCCVCCAPDDVSHEKDVLDKAAPTLISYYSAK